MQIPGFYELNWLDAAHASRRLVFGKASVSLMQILCMNGLIQASPAAKWKVIGMRVLPWGPAVRGRDDSRASRLSGMD